MSENRRKEAAGQPHVYLDHAATTPLDNRVLEAMLPHFTNGFGNASSLHSTGTQAAAVLDDARATIAGILGANPPEIYFTSGGTESNNWALKGIALANKSRGNHFIVSSIEHDCILNAARWLESAGFEITALPVDSLGRVDPSDVEKALRPGTLLVSVMHANNEIGTVEPIREIGAVCRHHGVLFHTDACQSFGKIPFDVEASNVDLATVNAHKIYGPKGTGALYIRKGVRIAPLLHGGGQESGLRSSTENVPSVAGFAMAAKLCAGQMAEESARLSELGRELATMLETDHEGVYFHGDPVHRLPGHTCFSLRGLEGETIRLLLLLDDCGFSVSAGSACSSNGSGSGSHVLKALGMNPFEARGAIRVTPGRFTAREDILRFREALHNCVAELNPIFS